MFRTAGPLCFAGSFLGLLLTLTSSEAQTTQSSTEGFISGAVAETWDQWQGAMQALLDRDSARSETAFGEILAANPSPLRLALLADRTVQRTPLAGAVLLMEQDLEAGALGPNGKEVASRLQTGREQMNEADDGWYFCQVGRFDVADANFRALLQANPDAVAVLDFAGRVPKRREVLLELVENPTVGESARAILKLLERGEEEIKADPTRIRENIERLGGPPRGFENAVEALKDSGEYAVPFMIQYLRDPAKRDLLQPILRCLPTIDRPAVNPLVIALRMEDQATKRYVIEALGKIGYGQAVPYLLQVLQDSHAEEGVKQAVVAALNSIRAHGTPVENGLSAAQAFYTLADDYYGDKPSLSADVRLEQANVWYWRDNMLVNIPVPTPVFNEIMCLRACEESLRLESDLKRPLALWLAADFRREAQLPEGEVDPTRPENYARASYFAQSAGAEYNLMALARAVDTADPAVALGTIAALRTTAGPSSLVGDAHGRLPLAEALSFPNRLVRIRAALALGHALPTETFLNYQNLMPVLSEALMLYGGARNALVVDPSAESANAVAAALRADNYEVLTDSSLYTGLAKVREQLPGIDVIVIASDIKEPSLVEGLDALRREFRFAETPVVLVTKPGGAMAVRDLLRADHRLTAVAESPSPAEIDKAVAAVSHAVGAQAITPELGATLAKDATEVLRLLALTNNPVFNVADAETGLLTALKSGDPDLRVAVAQTLGYLASGKAQEAIAKLALDPKEPEDMRVKMFAAVAEAAKRRGNLLPADMTQQIVTIVESEPNMTIREAASQALGALNLPGEPASTIIRNQYRG